MADQELKRINPATAGEAASGAPPSVNVEGYLATRTGQGEAARLYLRALRAAGVRTHTTTLTVADVIAGDEGARLMPTAPGEIAESVLEGEPDVNLVCVNGLELSAFASLRPPDYFSKRPSVGVWAWETDTVPESMTEASRLLDEVWVYSSYVAERLKPVLNAPVVAVSLPAIAPTPSGKSVRLDLPDGFMFLFAFDFLSTLGRKNPLGVVEAFSRAFEPGEGPHLVLKSINGQAQREAAERVRAAIAIRPDIHLIDRAIDADEKAALFARCGCYVSLHRAEGYGLTIAEAMALGKPVIATGYSGNREYMRPDNSYLVDYELVAVGAGNPVYPAEGTWAEPDTEHAAALMNRVWRDPDEAREIGDAARRHMRERFSPSVIGARARAQLERLVADDGRPRATTFPPMLSSQPVATLELGSAATELPGLAEMIEEVESGPEVIRPSAFWEQLIAQHVEWIQNTGFEDFKRTLNRHYFQFIPKSPFSDREQRDDSMWPLYNAVALQFRAVMRRWLRRPVARVLTAHLTEEVPAYLKVHFESAFAERLYAIYVAALWEQVRGWGGAALLDELEEPALGRPVAPRYRGRLISEDLCNSVLELTAICGALPGGRPGPGGVIELGAGYGRLAWVFANAFPQTRYVIVDIPPALAVSQRYLSELLPDRRIFRFRHFDAAAEVEEELGSAQLAFLTPNQLDLLGPLGAGLFVTISSLHEMTPPQITHYLERVGTHARGGHFYLKQWQRSINSSDGVVIAREDYPIPAGWEPVFDRPHPVQTAFFEALFRLPA